MRPERIRHEDTGAPAPDGGDPFAPVAFPWPATPPHDADGRVEGFASPSAVAPGDSVDFHVTVDPPRPFRVTVHRIGHYDGRGAAEIATSPRLHGTAQLPPLTAGRTVSCHHWWLSWRLPVPTYWNPGAYVAVVATEDGRHQAHVPFTVRDDRRRTCCWCCRTSPGRRTTRTRRRTAAPARASPRPTTSTRRTTRSRPSPSTARTRATGSRRTPGTPTT